MTRETQEQSEARAIRRRWITLGEAVAVAALVISGLTLWNSYAERKSSEVEQAQQASHSDVVAQSLRLKAARTDKDRRLDLTAVRDDQVIQSQTIRFPASLGLSAVDTAGDARIEASWFEDALKKARSAAGRKETTAGDERLPVEIVTRFSVDGADHVDDSLYDVGYGVEGHFLAGSSVLLHGLSRNGAAAAHGQAEIDRRWKDRMPAAK